MYIYIYIFGFVGFYGISIIVGYSMANPLSYVKTFLFQTIQFDISTRFFFQNSSISSNLV